MSLYPQTLGLGPVEYVPADVRLATQLDLETIDENIYRAPAGFQSARALFGGMVAAQALLAAGHTVTADWEPHSCHHYFLRAGRADLPIVFTVDRDRDGHGYTARRVTARQEGRVILNTSCSFTRDTGRGRGPGEDVQALVMPDVSPPGERVALPFVIDCVGSPIEGHTPAETPPSRFWVRCEAELPSSRLVSAVVVTYVSDLSTGMFELPDSAPRLMTSLDHAVWLHRSVPYDGWLLMDLHVRSVFAERGLYTGEIWAADGTLVASLAQECLYRLRRGPGA